MLFRSDSPRLIAPSVPRPVEPSRPVEPQRPQPEPPERSVSRLANVRPTPKPVAPIIRPSEPKIVPPTPESLRSREIEFQPTSFTPYDPYLGTVRSVMANLDTHRASLMNACELMRQGRQFRYLNTDPYRAQLPSVTETRRSGDCKSKALWLYDHLGDPGAYYVIGKLERGSRTSHAWVYWRNEGRWWILDPTGRSTPISADSISAHRYVPYYSYSRAGSFRHAATRLMLASNGIPATPAVAVRMRESAAEGRRASR